MKKLALVALTFAIVFGVTSGVLVLADGSNPGQVMYGVDRYVESMTLNVSKMMGNRAYGNLNLRLANERLSEVKYVTGKSNTNAFMFKSYAQNGGSSDNEIVKQLIADFNQNIKEVINAFNNETGSEKDLVLAQQIAQKTTEFSNQLVDILSDVDDEVETELEETSSILEDLDDDAVEALVEDSEEDDDSENRNLSIEKVTKTILKASEKLSKTKSDLEEKGGEKKITQEEALTMSAEITKIETQIDLAKVALANGELKVAYTNAKEAKDAVSKLRDMLDAFEADKEDSDEDGNESEDEDESEDDSKDDKDKGKNDGKKGSSNDDDEKDDDKSNDNSGKVEEDDGDDNSGKNETEDEDEVENEEEDETEEEDDDVKGVDDSNTSTLWIDLIF